MLYCHITNYPNISCPKTTILTCSKSGGSEIWEGLDWVVGGQGLGDPCHLHSCCLRALGLSLTHSLSLHTASHPPEPSRWHKFPTAGYLRIVILTSCFRASKVSILRLEVGAALSQSLCPETATEWLLPQSICQIDRRFFPGKRGEKPYSQRNRCQRTWGHLNWP